MNNFNFTESGYTPPAQGEYDFYFGEIITIYRILKSLSNDFVAIWADSDASLTNGKMYVSSEASFSVVNLETSIVEDYYTETRAGEAGEVLQGDDIVDINVP
jgi:hypothetical protein